MTNYIVIDWIKEVEQFVVSEHFDLLTNFLFTKVLRVPLQIEEKFVAISIRNVYSPLKYGRHDFVGQM